MSEENEDLEQKKATLFGRQGVRTDFNAPEIAVGLDARGRVSVLHFNVPYAISVETAEQFTRDLTRAIIVSTEKTSSRDEREAIAEVLELQDASRDAIKNRLAQLLAIERDAITIARPRATPPGPNDLPVAPTDDKWVVAAQAAPKDGEEWSWQRIYEAVEADVIQRHGLSDAGKELSRANVRAFRMLVAEARLKSAESQLFALAEKIRRGKKPKTLLSYADRIAASIRGARKHLRTSMSRKATEEPT